MLPFTLRNIYKHLCDTHEFFMKESISDNNTHVPLNSVSESQILFYFTNFVLNDSFILHISRQTVLSRYRMVFDYREIGTIFLLLLKLLIIF